MELEFACDLIKKNDQRILLVGRMLEISSIQRIFSQWNLQNSSWDDFLNTNESFSRNSIEIMLHMCESSSQKNIKTSALNPKMYWKQTLIDKIRISQRLEIQLIYFFYKWAHSMIHFMAFIGNLIRHWFEINDITSQMLFMCLHSHVWYRHQ